MSADLGTIFIVKVYVTSCPSLSIPKSLGLLGLCCPERPVATMTRHSGLQGTSRCEVSEAESVGPLSRIVTSLAICVSVNNIAHTSTRIFCINILIYRKILLYFYLLALVDTHFYCSYNVYVDQVMLRLIYILHI